MSERTLFADRGKWMMDGRRQAGRGGEGGGWEVTKKEEMRSEACGIFATRQKNRI